MEEVRHWCYPTTRDESDRVPAFPDRHEPVLHFTDVLDAGYRDEVGPRTCLLSADALAAERRLAKLPAGNPNLSVSSVS